MPRQPRCNVRAPDARNRTYGIYTAWYDDLGIRQQAIARGYATELDAEQACLDWKRGQRVDPSHTTIGVLCERWLEEEVIHSLRPKTIAQYSMTIRVHLLPRIGHIRAQKLTPSHVNALKGKMLSEGVGCRSIELALLRLSQVLKWAQQIELVERNMAERVEKPRCVPEEGIALTHEQARRFLAAAEDATYSPLWLLYLSTGLRRGEGIGLAWSDIDWKRHTLAIRRQVVLVNLKEGTAVPKLTDVKSRAARRTLDLDVRTVLALEQHRESSAGKQERQQFYRDADLIFCTRIGAPLSPNNVLRTFHKIAASCAMPDKLCIHDLRHTHATHMVLAGVPILEVSRRLGHSKPSITLDKYSHLVPGYIGSATAAVVSALHA